MGKKKQTKVFVYAMEWIGKDGARGEKWGNACLYEMGWDGRSCNDECVCG